MMRRSETPIEPVRKERRLALPVDEAFELFTHGMATWWPLETHSIAGHDAVGIRFEGHVGGRVVEITADGTEHEWADVVTWDPPARLVLAWHPTVDLVAASTIDARFETEAGGTRLKLEHRDWEEFGKQLGTELRDGYEPGWDVVLAPFEARAAR
jgi:hypothetical protein